MDEAAIRAVVARATLAPSVHNIQGWRWIWREGALLVGWDPRPWKADADAGLSCGAAVEAAVVALSTLRRGATVEDLWQADDRGTLPGHRLAARIVPGGSAAEDPLARQLEARFTHRGAFRPATVAWAPEDAALLTSPEDKRLVARLNDTVSLAVMQDRAVRAELLHWMRLVPGHPRAGIDGMDRRALRMSAPTALAARAALGPLWPTLDRLGLTAGMVAEAPKTESAAAIALFHRPEGESPVASGRAYLRLWLEATALGWAGWPMAALADDAATRAELTRHAGLPPGRRLVQALRFGPPDAPPPPRARRPLTEIFA